MTSNDSMNISMNKMDNYCDEKCAYSFNYQISNVCTATNYGSYLYLNYIESGTSAPVTFNSNTYKVDRVEIYSPSLHNFNGKSVEGEIIITHTPTSIGKPLIVCVPLSASGKQATTGTQIVTDIINAAVKKPLKQGEPTMNIKLNDYTLNSIIPVTPFFYYTGENDYHIIVYGIGHAISINSSVIENLQKLITPVTDVKYPSVEYLQYNKVGPSNGINDGQIYIDCQPTGNSEETEQVEYTKSETTNDLSTFFNSQVFLFIISAIIFVILIVIIHKFLVYLTSGKKGFPNVFANKS